MKIRRTAKQIEIMDHVLTAADTGVYLNMTQLYNKLSYTCTYGALRMSLKVLEEKGMLVKQRTGMSKNVVPTQLAYQWFR